MTKKIKLSFINKGKPFSIPHMTVRDQEELLQELAEQEKKDTPVDDKMQNKILLLKMLQRVDPNITMDNILDMHPQDFIALINLIVTTGRELSDEDVNFREKKK